MTKKILQIFLFLILIQFASAQSLGNGDSCTADANCSSKSCISGICCESSCSGDCYAGTCGGGTCDILSSGGSCDTCQTCDGSTDGQCVPLDGVQSSGCDGACEICNSGSCDDAPEGDNPGNICGDISCSGYYDGWSNLECFFKSDVSGSCTPTGSCKTASDVCESSGKGSSSGTKCDCSEATFSGCAGTTAPSCNNDACAGCTSDADCSAGTPHRECTGNEVYEVTPTSVCSDGECIDDISLVEDCTDRDNMILGCAENNVISIITSYTCSAGACTSSDSTNVNQTCSVSETCVNGACNPINNFCNTASDCPSDVTDYDCRNGDEDIYEVVTSYDCVNNVCTSSESENFIESCHGDDECADGFDECLDVDRDCDYDGDCDEDSEWRCYSGDVYKYTYYYECVDHECVEDDDDKELEDECDPDEYCVDGERDCLSKTDTTLILFTTTFSTTSSTRRQTTSTTFLLTTSTHTTTSSTSTSSTSTSSTTTSTTLVQDVGPSFMERIIFIRPLKNIVSVFFSILNAIFFWN